MLQKRVNSKKKGMRREREGRKIAEKEGYYVCPAKGSLGLWDFVCIARESAIMPPLKVVQVKSGKIYGKDRKKIEEYQICAAKEVWVKRNCIDWLRCRWNSNIQKWELL